MLVQFKNELIHTALVYNSNSNFQSRLSEVTFIPDLISSKVIRQTSNIPARPHD